MDKPTQQYWLDPLVYPCLRRRGQHALSCEATLSLSELFWETDRYDPQYDQRRLVGRVGKATSGFKECQQVGVELILVCIRQAMRGARIDLQGRVLDQLR